MCSSLCLQTVKQVGKLGAEIDSGMVGEAHQQEGAHGGWQLELAAAQGSVAPPRYWAPAGRAPAL